MNGINFTGRKRRDFHWAWHLAPIGTISIVLLSAILLTKPGDGPAPRLAQNAMSIAAKTTVVVPALAAKPVEGRTEAEAEIETQPPTMQ